jgi:hypothetical protein
MSPEQIRANMIAAEAWPEGTTADEKGLRRLLAGAYGITYGDDGELQNSAEHPFIDFKRDSVADLALKMGKRAIAKMGSEYVKSNGFGWIDVYERLPDDGQLVIIAGGVGKCYREAGGAAWFTATGEDFGRRITWPVTHWMPLLFPPNNVHAAGNGNPETPKDPCTCVSTCRWPCHPSEFCRRGHEREAHAVPSTNSPEGT